MCGGRRPRWSPNLAGSASRATRAGRTVRIEAGLATAFGCTLAGRGPRRRGDPPGGRPARRPAPTASGLPTPSAMRRPPRCAASWATCAPTPATASARPTSTIRAASAWRTSSRARCRHPLLRRLARRPWRLPFAPAERQYRDRRPRLHARGDGLPHRVRLDALLETQRALAELAAGTDLLQDSSPGRARRRPIATPPDHPRRYRR